MAAEDNLQGTITPDGYYEDLQRSQRLRGERLGQYQRLMRETGVRSIVVLTRGNGEIRFRAASVATMMTGAGKGIAYSPQPPKAPVVASLEESCFNLVSSNVSACEAMRHVKDNWWLLLEVDP